MLQRSPRSSASRVRRHRKRQRAGKILLRVEADEHGLAHARDRHRENQRRYEARQRDGIGLYVVPLTSCDIDVLISLGYLREGAEGNRQQVGEAVAAVIRELGGAN